MKTINIRFKKKHIIMGIITFSIFLISIYIYPEKFGFYEYTEVHCTDGSKELFNDNNWIYCGQDIRVESYNIVDFK